MKKAILAFVVTIILGFVGMIIDSNFGFGGTLGIIISIATMGVQKQSSSFIQ